MNVGISRVLYISQINLVNILKPWGLYNHVIGILFWIWIV